jgi:hypothetical protein
MAISEEEKNAKWAEKDSSIKKDIQDEVLHKQRLMKRQYQRTVGAENEELKRAEKAKDPLDGKLWWDKVKESVQRLQAAAGYQEWQNLMNEFVVFCATLNTAMRKDPIELTHFIPYKDEIGGIWLTGKDAFHDYVLKYPENLIDRQFLDDKELPGVGFTVSLDEHNKLVVEVTKDGKPDEDPEQKVKEHLKIGFAAWAVTQGYEFDSNENSPTYCQYKDEAGTVMDQNKLLEINADVEESFLKFAIGRYEMPLTQGMRP